MTDEEMELKEEDKVDAIIRKHRTEIEEDDLITKANDAAKRLEDANKETAKMIAILQREKVEKTLSGTTVAGVKFESIEEKQIKAAKKVLEGTGLEDHAFPKETGSLKK